MNREVDSMMSGKQRRLEIKTRRQKRAMALKLKPGKANALRPLGRIHANIKKLDHNNTYCGLPLFYEDIPFTCSSCGAGEVWTAAKQKWWYEYAKGYIWSTATHCHSCRLKIRREKEQQRTLMSESDKREPHPNEAFFKKRY